MELRDYQQSLYGGIINSLHSHKRVLGVAPCGAGKSYIFAKMIEQAKGEVLILCHRKELLNQHDELLRSLGLDGKYRLAMIMTEANRLGRYPNPSLIVCDEAHLSRSNSWVKVLNYYRDAYVVGLTATPCRLDGKPLSDVYDDLVDSVSVRWLIDNGRLAPYEYYAPMEVNADGLQTRAGDYITSDLEELMMDRAIYSDVLDSYIRIADGEKAIAYCVSVKHAREVADMFNSAGIKAVEIDAGTKNREQILNDFRESKYQILCNVGIISEGVSIDDVTCCILLRPTESIALDIQQMMRCMRYLPGKSAKIIDCVGNYLRVGLPDTDRQWSLTEKSKKPKRMDREGNLYIRTCPECFQVFKTASVCPYCGAEYPLSPREIKAKDDIKLQRITQEEMERVEAEKKKMRMQVGRARSIEELIKIGKERGYKNPVYWANQVMRGRK